MEARPTESIDVLAVYGDARPLGSQGSPDKYEKIRANTAGVGGVGPAVARGNIGGNARGNVRGNAGRNAGGNDGGNVGGNIAPQVRGCTYKTFLAYNPHSFSETKGILGLSRWFEKL
ncbi:hypothetical protein Tco_0161239, partial [Tanacetum coccineum]